MNHFQPGQSIIDLNGVLRFSGARSLGPPPPVTLVYDTFTLPDYSSVYGHVPDVSSSGDSWIDVIFPSVVINNRVTQWPEESVFSNSGLLLTDSADCTISANFFLPTLASVVGLYFRTTNSTNYWRAVWYKTGFFRIIERTSSTFTRSSVALPWYSGSLHSIKVILSGNNISAYVDDAFITSYASSVRATVKSHGFIMTDVTSADGWMDDFRVTVP